MKEYSKHGSMKILFHQLNRAVNKGKSDKEHVLKEVFSTCASNIVKKKQASVTVKVSRRFMRYLCIGVAQESLHSLR